VTVQSLSGARLAGEQVRWSVTKMNIHPERERPYGQILGSE